LKQTAHAPLAGTAAGCHDRQNNRSENDVCLLCLQWEQGLLGEVGCYGKIVSNFEPPHSARLVIAK